MTKIPRIQFKRTKNPGVKPSKDILAEGELAINLADRTIFTKLDEEIIDLGFAKGGTVNGDIIQEAGKFTTNGVLTVQSPINPGINFLKRDTNEYLRLETKNNEGLFIFGDGGQAKAFVKLPKETGTIATREWSNSNKVDKKGDTLTGELRWTNKSPGTYTQFIESTAVNDPTAKNFIRKFRNRLGGYLWHEVVDENGLSYYTGTTINQLRVQLGISGVRIDGGASYGFNGPVRKAGIDAIVDQGYWSTWRERPALVQMRCQSNNGSSSLFKILSNTGKPIAAFGGFSTTGDETQSRFQFRFGNKSLDYHNGGVSLSSGNMEVSNGTYSRYTLSDVSKNNQASLLINDNGIPYFEWKNNGALKGQLFLSQGNVATQEWTNSNFYNKTDSDNRYVHLGTGDNIRLHSYKSGGHGYSSWYENNVRQAYIGFENNGSTEFTINNEKGSNGTINLKAGNVLVNSATVATQNWSNSNHYKKAETYNKSEIDGKVNGRLTQAQADGRYPLKGNVYTKTESDGRYMRKGEAPSGIKFTGIRNINPVSVSQHDSKPGYSISYFNKEELYGRLVRFTYWDWPEIGAGRELESSGWSPYFGNGSVHYNKRGTHARAQVAY